MTLEPVINTMPTNVITSCLESCQEGITWLGHTLISGFSDYVLPTAEKLGGLAMEFFSNTQSFMQSAPFPAAMILGGIVLLSVAAFKLADNEAIKNDELAKRALQTFGTLTLVSAIALATLGVAAILI